MLAAYLSLPAPVSDFRSSAEVAWFLTRGSHDCILRAGFGRVPSGMRGALGRSGDKIQDRRYYRYLHRLLARHDEQSIAIAVSRLAVVDFTRLRIARALPADMLHESIIGHLRNVDHASDLGRVVALLEQVGVDRTAMIDALTMVSSKAAIASTVRRWSLKARLPEHPVPCSASYKPIATGDELRQAARQYQNCMRSYLASVLERRSAFGLLQHGNQEAIVHLAYKDGGWQLDRLYGSMNCPVTTDVRRAAEAHLAAHGVGVVARPAPVQAFDPLRRLTGGYDPDEDD